MTWLPSLCLHCIGKVTGVALVFATIMTRERMCFCTTQVVQTVERILYASNDEESKRVIADAQVCASYSQHRICKLQQCSQAQ